VLATTSCSGSVGLTVPLPDGRRSIDWSRSGRVRRGPTPMAYPLDGTPNLRPGADQDPTALARRYDPDLDLDTLFEDFPRRLGVDHERPDRAPVPLRLVVLPRMARRGRHAGDAGLGRQVDVRRLHRLAPAPAEEEGQGHPQLALGPPLHSRPPDVRPLARRRGPLSVRPVRGRTAGRGAEARPASPQDGQAGRRRHAAHRYRFAWPQPAQDGRTGPATRR
jgi:hypothetical protein